MNVTLSQQEISKNPLILGILLDNNSSRTKFLSSLLRQLWQYREIFPSQTCLALSNDRCRATANRQLSVMEQMGWITKKRRYNSTCVYKINPLIIAARHLLWEKFPVLKTISIFLLHSAVIAGLQENVTSSINSLFINNQSYQSSYVDRHPTCRMTYRYRKVDDEIVREEGKRVVKQSVKEYIITNFGLDANFLAEFDDDFLKDVCRSYMKASNKRKIDNPAGYLRTAIIQRSQDIQIPKMGSSNVVKQSDRQSTNHSPASEVPNLTHIEQIEYLMNEISKFAKSFNSDEISSSPEVMKDYLLKIAQNSIKGMQKEVERLIDIYNDADHSCGAGCVEQSRYIRVKKPEITEKKFIPWDQEYEDHLQEISKDKTDPDGYKLMVRKTDLRRRGINPEGVIYGTKK